MTDKEEISNHHLKPELLENFLNVQERELVIRAQQVDLQKQEINNAHEYAKAALEASVRDREEERNKDKSMVKTHYFFIIVIVIALIGFFSFALFLNKDEIVVEVIKALVLFGSGGMSGYAFAKRTPIDSK